MARIKILKEGRFEGEPEGEADALKTGKLEALEEDVLEEIAGGEEDPYGDKYCASWRCNSSSVKIIDYGPPPRYRCNKCGCEWLHHSLTEGW